jgi:hypothetical protein
LKFAFRNADSLYFAQIWPLDGLWDLALYNGGRIVRGMAGPISGRGKMF